MLGSIFNEDAVPPPFSYLGMSFIYGPRHAGLDTRHQRPPSPWASLEQAMIKETVSRFVCRPGIFFLNQSQRRFWLRLILFTHINRFRSLVPYHGVRV